MNTGRLINTIRVHRTYKCNKEFLNENKDKRRSNNEGWKWIRYIFDKILGYIHKTINLSQFYVKLQ